MTAPSNTNHIFGILGQPGSGKSTVASMLAKETGLLLFDMDLECAEEQRARNRMAEAVPADEVKRFQFPMIEKLLAHATERDVILAGFFLDDELPEYILSRANATWINLVTDDRELLLQRVSQRANHFANSAADAIFNENWSKRHKQRFGLIHVDCAQSLSEVIDECRQHILAVRNRIVLPPSLDVSCVAQ